MRLLALEKPDGLLFCGDGVDDFGGVTLPAKTMFVAGNCDFFSKEPLTRELVWEGVRIFMTHGHRYMVKRTTDVLLSEGYARDAQVVLYGHTHMQSAEYHGGLLLLNPGTMSRYNQYYAILTLTNGVYDCELKQLSLR